uniref:ULP_PROTEASE domain-containing protein n=1 Tax=Mesocestoides corti TaxID=53468 RepID=A0A5K3EF90_MESCO
MYEVVCASIVFSAVHSNSHFAVILSIDQVYSSDSALEKLMYQDGVLMDLTAAWSTCARKLALIDKVLRQKLEHLPPETNV